MSYLIVEPKDKKEQQLVQDMLRKMHVSVINEEDEDKAILKALQEVDFSRTVPVSRLRRKLRSK